MVREVVMCADNSNNTHIRAAVEYDIPLPSYGVKFIISILLQENNVVHAPYIFFAVDRTKGTF